MNRIIIRPPKVSLNDFIGDFNYLPSLIRQAKHEPMPTMYDVKQLTALYGILPFGLLIFLMKFFQYRKNLGSEKVHETAPQIKGLLICGPRGCGKHMLLHAICNELGANLFDISPQNIFETYREKEGIKMLMHLCSKVNNENNFCG
jgi:SpoVK/Ycf46/Vps4 family AAA+-type ATPase